MLNTTSAAGVRKLGWWTAMVAGVWVAAAGRPAAADQVTLKNGTRLDGKVVTLDGGKLTVNVPGMGDVKVDADQIATFGTDVPVEVHLVDGTVLQRQVTAAPDGRGEVVIGAGPASILPNQPTKLSDVTQINPPSPWVGTVTAGALIIRGNTDTESLNLGVNVARKTTQDTLALTAAYLYGRTHDRKTNVVTTTTENWQIESRYDYNFTPRFYGFLDFLVRKDRIAFLDLRLVPSGGVGYKFFNDPDFTLSGEVGLAWVYEKYTNNTPTREDVSGRFAYHVTKKFNGTLSAFHDVEYLQSVERGGNYLISADVGVRAQLTTHFFGEAKITLIYDSNPANGALKTDTFYGVNLGYTL